MYRIVNLKMMNCRKQDLIFRGSRGAISGCKLPLFLKLNSSVHFNFTPHIFAFLLKRKHFLS